MHAIEQGQHPLKQTVEQTNILDKSYIAEYHFIGKN